MPLKKDLYPRRLKMCRFAVCFIYTLFRNREHMGKMFNTDLRISMFPFFKVLWLQILISIGLYHTARIAPVHWNEYHNIFLVCVLSFNRKRYVRSDHTEPYAVFVIMIIRMYIAFVAWRTCRSKALVYLATQLHYIYEHIRWKRFKCRR